jgi:hypothetical protein
MALIWPFKDPDELLDYSIDWSGRLGSDTISTSVWTVPDGITNEDEEKTTTTTTLWLSGGTLAVTYEFLNRIVTAGGRIMDQTTRLKIKSK